MITLNDDNNYNKCASIRSIGIDFNSKFGTELLIKTEGMDAGSRPLSKLQIEKKPIIILIIRGMKNNNRLISY